MHIITKPYLDTKIKPEHMVTPCEMHQHHGITIILIQQTLELTQEQMVPTVGKLLTEDLKNSKTTILI